MKTRVSKRRAIVGGLLVAVAGALVAGCSYSEPGDDASTHSYVGTAQGTAALVAVVVDGARVQAYVCDGMPGDPVGTAPTVQAWWNGPSDGHTVDVRQAAGRLQVRLTGDIMSGTLTLADGRTLSVSGTAAKKDAGLYRAEAPGAVAGWILGSDGTQRGGVGGTTSDSGGPIKLSAVRTLTLSEPTISLQGLATARIAKVGITPIPIP